MVFTPRHSYRKVTSSLRIRKQYILFRKIVTGKIGDLEPSWTMAALFDSVDDLNGCPESPLCPVEEFLNLLKEMRQDPNLQEIRKMTPLEELE